MVERYKAIQDFVEESFWKLLLVHTKDDLQTEFVWNRGRLFEKEPVEVILDLCSEEETASVTKFVQKPKNRLRPVAMDTIELEKLAVRKLRMSAKEAMAVAERLYTQGYISYPRTETNKFPTNMNLNNLIAQQGADPNWGNFAAAVQQRGANPRNGRKTDEAHPPIHPTKYAAPNVLNGNEHRLYELVVRHFLACCSWDATGQETIIEATISNETFTATGLIITDRAWLDVYPYDQWKSKTIPAYQMGEVFVPDEINWSKGKLPRRNCSMKLI